MPRGVGHGARQEDAAGEGAELPMHSRPAQAGGGSAGVDRLRQGQGPGPVPPGGAARQPGRAKGQARIKRTIVFVHADRDEHVDADTAKEIGLVLKGSTEWIRFDSKREAKRYVALRIEQRHGTIRNLQRQVKFALQVRRPDQLLQTIATWTADFVYERKRQHAGGTAEALADVLLPQWDRVVEDCKGMRTEIYQRSRKHFIAQYGIDITET